ncbi:MAG: outer membrane beta-barrel protein [Bacteroides sp.]|nr:outer membrane beta-barrel protein [Bacteroides sp.]
MKNIYVFLIGSFFASVPLYGQHPTVKVSGQILTHTEETLPQAVVTYLLLPDSTAMNYAVSDEDGLFELNIATENVAASLLEISYIGYEKRIIPVSRESMKIYLKESTQHIGEIEVKAKAIVTKKPGKFIYTPPASGFVTSIDSYELLSFAPLLTVVDGGISMLGKGQVMIYINGRAPVMGQKAAMEMLRSTPAEKIKRIEVINSPNSSYKASYTGGIVNVILKNNPDEGWTGRAAAGTTYAYEKLSSRGTLYLGYSKNKFRFATNIVASDRHSYKETSTIYDYKTSGVSMKGLNTDKDKGFGTSAYISLAYDINSKSTIGGSLGAARSISRGESSMISTYYSQENVDSILNSLSSIRTPKTSPTWAGSLYYMLKTDSKGSVMDVSAKYNCSYNNTEYKMNYYRLPEGKMYDSFIQNPITDFDAYEFKAVYSHYFNDENLLEFGLESTNTRIDNDFIRRQWSQKDYLPDPTQSNRFIYDEFINALFINYEREWNDVFSTEIGIRGEQTIIKGNQKTQQEKFRQNYFHMFPQINMNWDLAEGDHTISLDLSSSIFRPYYNYLNPFRRWLSQNTYEAGNKDLKPETSYEVDLMYILKRDYIFNINYSYDKNAIGQYTLKGEDNTTVYSLGKYGHSNSLDFSSQLRKQWFNDIWEFSFSVTGRYSNYRGDIDGENISSDSWSGNVNCFNLWQLSKQHKMYMTLYYYYSLPTLGLTKKFTHKQLFSVSIRKQFNFGGVVEISATNLLNYKGKNYFDTPDFYYDVTPLGNRRTFSVSYSHTFGNRRVRGAKDTSSTRVNSRINNE